MVWARTRFTKASWVVAASMAVAAQAVAAQYQSLTLDLDEPIEVEVKGELLEIALHTGAVDFFNLLPETAARLEIKPAFPMGKSNIKIGKTKVLTGRNRSINFTVEGMPHKARVSWFEGASGIEGHGSVGPWAIPHDRVAIRLGGALATSYSFPLFGRIDTQSFTRFSHDGGSMGLLFAVENTGSYPIASAAAGAAIAKAYDGVATDEVWEEPIFFGVQRPVRLVRLGRPLVIGPFSFDTIAVRVRDRLDGLGAGDRLPEPASADDDPSEIVVTAPDNKGPQPIFSFVIGRTALEQCSMIEYIKSAQEIRLSC